MRLIPRLLLGTLFFGIAVTAATFGIGAVLFYDSPVNMTSFLRAANGLRFIGSGLGFVCYVALLFGLCYNARTVFFVFDKVQYVVVAAALAALILDIVYIATGQEANYAVVWGIAVVSLEGVAFAVSLVVVVLLFLFKKYRAARKQQHERAALLRSKEKEKEAYGDKTSIFDE